MPRAPVVQSRDHWTQYGGRSRGLEPTPAPALPRPDRVKKLRRGRHFRGRGRSKRGKGSDDGERESDTKIQAAEDDDETEAEDVSEHESDEKVVQERSAKYPFPASLPGVGTVFQQLGPTSFHSQFYGQTPPTTTKAPDCSYKPVEVCQAKPVQKCKQVPSCIVHWTALY